MTVFDDLAAEQDRLDHILSGLDEAQWTSPSGAGGWTIADVVLHLAQSEESVVVTLSGRGLRTSLGAMTGGTVEERVAEMVRAERAAPEVVFGRWQRARQSSLSALRAADSVILPTVGHHAQLTHAELLARLIGEWFLPSPPC